MVAFPFRMGAGFAGDVNRSHPASIVPAMVDPAAPPQLFGGLVFYDRTTVNGVRAPASGDASGTPIPGDGVVVRPFPAQQQSGSNYGAVGFGPGTPPATGVIDILKSGYVIAKVNGTPNLGGPVYVWCAASTGNHVQGGFEAAASSGNTVQLDGKTTFNGPPDASGLVEIGFNI